MKHFHTFDDLFWKYMLAYKKRTIFTVMGITFAVMLFFGAGTLYTSISHAEYNKNRQYYGDYDAEGMVNPEQYQVMRHLDYIDEMLLFQEQSQLFMDGHEETGACFIRYLERFDQDFFSYELLEGRYPENSHEILMSQYQAEYYQLYIGDQIKINREEYWYNGRRIGSRYEAHEYIRSLPKDERDITIDNDFEKKVISDSYQVTGIYEEKNVNTDSVANLGFYDGFVSRLDQTREYDYLYVSVRFAHRKNYLEKLANEGIYLDENSLVTKYQAGYSKNELAGLLEYILFVLVFAILFWIAVGIIRNVFVISVAERARDYGILRCMGTSKYRLRRLLIKEGLVMGLMGNLLGMGVTYLLIEMGKYLFGFRQILIEMGLYPFFHAYSEWWVIVGSMFLTMCAVLFSLLEPARQIGLISPIEAINGNAVIRKEKIKKVKTGWVRKLLGIEGEYAVKNLMRNKGKFIASTVGIIFSVVGIVLSFSMVHIVKTLFDIGDMQDTYSGVASYRNRNGITQADINAYAEQLLALKSVEDVEPRYAMNWNYYVLPEKEETQLLKKENAVLGNDFIGIDEEQLAQLDSVLVEGSLDYAALQQGGVILSRSYKDTSVVNGEVTEYLHPIAEVQELHVGDYIAVPRGRVDITDRGDLTTEEYQEAYMKELNRIGYERYPIVAVISYTPFPKTGISVLLAREYYQKEFLPDIGMKEVEAEGLEDILIKFNERFDIGEIQDFMIENSNDYIYEDGTMELISTMNGYQGLILLIAIIIAGIGSVNIFNTFSANIALRSREFQIMRTIGMSRRQILKMLGLEGGLAAIVGSILGSGIGVGVSYWLTRFAAEIQNDGVYYNIKFWIPWGGILLSVLLAVLITGISVWIAKQDVEKEEK